MDEPTMVVLVGEQPIPVLLPILELRPAKVLFVSTDRTEKVGRRVASRCEGASETLILRDGYDLPRIQAALKEKLDQEPGVVFNVTGGTKIMAFAAYELAAERRAPFVYYQTEGRGREQRGMLYRYAFDEAGRALMQERRELQALITLDDYLRAHVDHYDEEKFSKDEGGDFEQAVFRALEGSVDEIKHGIRPAGVKNQVEIDLMVRCGNQVAVLEVKGGGGDSGKKAVDQLTTSAAREYLGTYTSRFIVIGQPMDSSYKALATALRVTVVELPGYRRGRALDDADTRRLRQALAEQLPRSRPAETAAAKAGAQ